MTIVRLADIPDPGLLPITLTSGERVVLIRRGEVVSALEDQCPHQSMPLSAGELCADESIECPWHGARFDIRTGACRQGPATDPVRVFAVEVRDGQVIIRSPA